MYSKFSWKIRQIACRSYTSGFKGKQCCSPDPAQLDEALKKLYAEFVSIPVAIGNQMIFTGDEQNLLMPHNHQRIAAKYYYATKNHINMAIENALSVKETWSNIDAKLRSEIFHKAADKLSATEKQAELISAIILSQAKTRQEAQIDASKLIFLIRTLANSLLKLSEIKLPSISDKIKPKFVLRPLDGFVAATGPMFMSWNSANLALCPLIMGNCVVWRPSLNFVLTSFIIFKAVMAAGVTRGALQFLPSNYKLFLNTVINSDDLAGINYAGRVVTLRNLWHDLSIRLPHYKCFPRLVGECDSKGYHFVHESSDVDLVVDRTIQAAFRNAGQTTYSCGRFYVPSSLWPEISCQLQSTVESLKIGDPTDENTYASAILREDMYEDVVAHLKYAKSSENVEILMNGNFVKTHGFFIEPTIIVCKDPNDRMMIEEIMGPVLCVYVYDNNKLDDVIEILKRTQKFGSCGAIFCSDEDMTANLLNKLRMTASNLYVNEQCSGQELSHLPLSGNRLSGTNDKNSAAYYLLKFAAPQIIEEPMAECEDSKEMENQNCSC